LLVRPYWGNGYATEAAQASLQYGFEHVKLEHIIALVHPENLASQRVIDKCGMSYQETISLWGMQLKRYRIDKGWDTRQTILTK
jgi:ribosomal-protein-alanine N-acetyltransferase